MTDYRSVAFKYRGTILALPAAVLAWLGRPSAFSIATGLPVAFAGEFIRCWAVGYSGVTTRGNEVSAPMLVTAGPYAYVRNPLYVGNTVTALGFAIAFTGRNRGAARLAIVAGSVAAIVGLYAVIVPHEEAYLRSRFPEAFEAYAASVPPIVPRLSGAEGAGTFDPGVIGRAETRTFVTFAAMLAVLALRARD